MSESAPTIEYATSTAADAHAIRARRFVAWVGVVVGLAGLIWTGMMWRMHYLDEDYALGLLFRAKPQVVGIIEWSRVAHAWAEGILSVVVLGSCVTHIIRPAAWVPVQGMRLYAVGLFGYTVVLAILWVLAQGDGFSSYEEEEWLYLSSHWIPRQVHELVYAAFVLYFMRVPRRARRVEGHGEELASG